MTTVAALARDGDVWMAADSATSVYDRPVRSARKIQRHTAAGGGEVLVGVAGCSGLATALSAGLRLGQPDGDDLDGWAGEVARQVGTLAAASYLLDAGRLRGRLILGCRGRLWTITHMAAVAHPDGVAAVGTGQGAAVGAIDAILTHTALPPPEVLPRAVAIAVARDRYSAGPIRLEFLPGIGSAPGTADEATRASVSEVKSDEKEDHDAPAQ